MNTRKSATLRAGAMPGIGRNVGNIDPQDLRCRARGRRGVTLNVRRSALGDSWRGDLSYGRRTGFF